MKTKEKIFGTYPLTPSKGKKDASDTEHGKIEGMAKEEELKYDEKYYANIDFIYQIVSKKFERLDESDKYVTNKVGLVLAGLIPLLAFYFSLWDKIDQTILLWGMGLAFFSSIFLLLALTAYNFYDPPKMKEIYSEEAFEKDIFDLKSDVSSKMVGDYYQNKKTLAGKSRLLTIAIIIIIASILVVSSGFVYNGVYGHKQQGKETKTATHSPKT